jgi:hypothetical protein
MIQHLQLVCSLVLGDLSTTFSTTNEDKTGTA